jgi:hypothetical protein
MGGRVGGIFSCKVDLGIQVVNRLAERPGAQIFNPFVCNGISGLRPDRTGSVVLFVTGVTRLGIGFVAAGYLKVNFGAVCSRGAMGLK